MALSSRQSAILRAPLLLPWLPVVTLIWVLLCLGVVGRWLNDALERPMRIATLDPETIAALSTGDKKEAPQ